VTPVILAFDLGTGGCKAALYWSDGTLVAATSRFYQTHYPALGRHEQAPEDWWRAVVGTTRELLEAGDHDVVAIALSGQSLAVLPLDAGGELLLERCPIWSDTRGASQAAVLFESLAEADWYGRTGNGFPSGLYSAFKVMWLRQHAPQVFARTRVFIGSKDWINWRLTGRLATDHSYASGSGVYDLRGRDYDDELLAATGLTRELWPPIVEGTDLLGGLTAEAARQLGVPAGVPVVCGGVDNSCMAIGAGSVGDGDFYASLGSSSWLTLTASQPVLDDAIRPFVFAGAAGHHYHSAVSTFGAGTSLAWVRDMLLAPDGGSHERLVKLADCSVAGARGLMFLPTLAGGTSLEGGPQVRGAYLGLTVAHVQADLARAALEGVALALRRALEALRSLTEVPDHLLVVGGGAKSAVARQIYADVLGLQVTKTSVDQQAATLGAAALAAVGVGLWSDVAQVRDVHQLVDRHEPDSNHALLYERLLPSFVAASQWHADLFASR